MPTFLHLNLLSSGDELLIEGNIRYSMRATLADNFKRVEGPCDYVASEVDTSFDHSDGSFDWTFDESL